jgi:transposase
MTLYCGIDLHSNNILLSIIDHNDQLIIQKRLPNQLEIITKLLSQYALGSIAVESTFNWYWLVDGLIDIGYRVHLANTLAIQQYKGIKYTNDASDARFLANLLRLNILPTGFIYPKEIRVLRDALRRRTFLVTQRTQQMLSLQSLMSRDTGKQLSAQDITLFSQRELSQRLPNPTSQLMVSLHLNSIESLNTQINRVEKWVLSNLPKEMRKNYQRILTLPGVGKMLGLTILLESGPIQRFASAGNYSSYARCVPSERISNGKSKGRNNAKNGNKHLSFAFVQAAHYATIWYPQIKAFYQQRSKKRHKMVAKKTIANKLTRACYHMLTEQRDFEMTKML